MEELKQLLFGGISPDKGGNIEIMEAFVNEETAEVVLHCKDNQVCMGFLGTEYERTSENLIIRFSNELYWNIIDFHDDENYQNGWFILFNHENLGKAYEWAIKNLPTYEEYNKAKIKQEFIEICKNLMQQKGLEKLKTFLVETGEEDILNEIL